MVSPISNATIQSAQTAQKALTSPLVSLPVEIQLEVLDRLHPSDLRSLLQALITPTLNNGSPGSPVLKLYLLHCRILPKYRHALVSADTSLLAYASNQLQILGEAGELDQVIEKYAFFKLLYLLDNSFIFEFLKKTVQQNLGLQKKLLDWVKRSEKEEVQAIASRALTFLVQSGVQLNGANLRGIRVPYADLSGGMFDHAQLQDADLTGVQLQQAWLHRANLNGAQMAEVQFGELPFLEEDSMARACAYSPHGRTCAVGLLNGHINVYDTSNWQKIQTFVCDGRWKNSINSVVFSPTGDQLACGSEDNTVRLWDMKTGDLLHALTGHTKEVRSVAYSPRGNQIASGSRDNTVCLWDAKTGVLLHTLTGHTKEVQSVVFSPTGDQLASGSEDRTVRLWDVEIGVLLYTLTGYGIWSTSVVYSPKGDQIAFGSEDNTVRQWDFKTGAPLRLLKGHTNYVTGVAYSPKGDQIASGSLDKTVCLWDAKTGVLLRILRGHKSEVTRVLYSPKGDHIASIGRLDNKVRLWEVKTDASSRTLNGQTSLIYSIASSLKSAPSGRRESTALYRWNWDTSCHFFLNTPSFSVDSTYSHARSPKGDQIASGTWVNTVGLRDLKTGAPIRTLQGHKRPVYSVVYSPNGDQLASGSGDNTVRLWDVKIGDCHHILNGHSSTVSSLAYSPIGDQLVSGSHDYTLRLWDSVTGACHHILSGHTSWVTSVAYSTGDQLASGSMDNKVRLWDVKTGVCLHVLEGHSGTVNSVAFSPKGDLIASGSDDYTVRIWDVETGCCKLVLEDPIQRVADVCWREKANSLYLAVGSEDKSVRLLRVIKEGAEYWTLLCSSTAQEALTVRNALIEGVKGLSEENERLLKQRQAISLRA